MATLPLLLAGCAGGRGLGTGEAIDPRAAIWRPDPSTDVEIVDLAPTDASGSELEIRALPGNVSGMGGQGGMQVGLLSGTRLEPSKTTLVANGKVLSPGEYQINPVTGSIKLAVAEENWAAGMWVQVHVSDNLGNTGAAMLAFDTAAAPRTVRDEIIYQIVTDRFADGNESNNEAAETSVAHKLDSWQGGDWQGVRDVIESGYFEKLGATTLWLSPAAQQPQGAWPNPVSIRLMTTPFLGEWPVAPRSTDARLGTLDDLRGVVTAAHLQRIAVVLGHVAHQVHQDHPWVAEHPDWFVPKLLTDGSENVRLFDRFAGTTWFAGYLPRFDMEFSEAARQAVIDEARWWLTESGADGLAFAEAAISPADFWGQMRQRLASDAFSTNGGQPALLGAACIAPGLQQANGHALDTQVDEALVVAVRECLAMEETGLDSLMQTVVKARSGMNPTRLPLLSLGSTCSPRFLAFADGDIAPMKSSEAMQSAHVDQPDSFDRLRLASIFMMTVPVVPAIFQGDEGGMTGGEPPDNLAMFVPHDQRSDGERRVFRTVSRWAAARRDSVALRRGELQIMDASAERLVFARVAPEEVVVVSMARKPADNSVSVPLPEGWGEPASFEVLALDGIGERDATLRRETLVIQDSAYSAGAWRLRW